MEPTRNCAECGAPIPGEAGQSLCPRCLLNLGLQAGKEGSLSAERSQTAPPPLPTPAQGRPVPGQMFGGYRICSLLGQGGMGQVFEAEHAETGRRVALKVMSQALSSQQDRKRFLREGRLAASVNHPN